MSDISYELGSDYWTTPLDCGHVPTAPTSFHKNGFPLTTGAAHSPEGTKVCYSCAAKHDMADIEAGRDVFAYVSGDGKSITSWPGITLMKVTYNGTARTGWHGSEISYIRAVAPSGKQYYGKNGGNGMAIRLRANKGQS